MRLTIPLLATLTAVALAAGCSSPAAPEASGVVTPAPIHDGSLRTAALDYFMDGDLSDPAVAARYARADLLIVQSSHFWGRPEQEGRLAELRALNPDMKIIGYFRAKTIRAEWADLTRSNQSYFYDLYQAALPYHVATTAQDTAMDWPGAMLFDFSDPEARAAMLDVFVHYQTTSSNRFDGIFWDYFGTSLWIHPAVTGMEGDPDMDGDGIGHWDDPDELAAFKAGQDAWPADLQRRLGADFIQIANGMRAAKDSTFAGKFDGIFYEIFPKVGFYGAQPFAQALDPDHYNNLFAARRWPRTTNGGPWLVLSHAPLAGSYRDTGGSWLPVNTGDVNRIVALLTGAAPVHYDNSGRYRAGVPAVEYDLGPALGPTVIAGTRYTREFANGRVRVELVNGDYPLPFTYEVVQGGVVVDKVVAGQ